MWLAQVGWAVVPAVPAKASRATAVREECNSGGTKARQPLTFPEPAVPLDAEVSGEVTSGRTGSWQVGQAIAAAMQLSISAANELDGVRSGGHL